MHEGPKFYTRDNTLPSVAEMLIQECSDLSEGFPGLGHAIVELVLGVRHSFEDFELGLYARLA